MCCKEKEEEEKERKNERKSFTRNKKPLNYILLWVEFVTYKLTEMTTLPYKKSWLRKKWNINTHRNVS